MKEIGESSRFACISEASASEIQAYREDLFSELYIFVISLGGYV